MDIIFTMFYCRSNIYIRHQETSTVRDIFLAPFSLRLIGCVVAVALFASTIVVIISRLTIFLQTTHRPMPYTEAFLWSTGILCQQGILRSSCSSLYGLVIQKCLFFPKIEQVEYKIFYVKLATTACVVLKNIF